MKIAYPKILELLLEISISPLKTTLLNLLLISWPESQFINTYYSWLFNYQKSLILISLKSPINRNPFNSEFVVY